ncbi:MAG: hypothetical protein PHY73_05295 [Candidatus Omnitrophica bacterium]|nr:hypothetical protein [Candidatus Omnitrophota bacterium]
MRFKTFFLFIVVFFLFLSLASISVAADPDQNTDFMCAAYLTGIGCHNCAVVDPLLFSVLTAEKSNFIIFDYEIYKKDKYNKKVKEDYFASYLREGERRGVPFFILNHGAKAMGKMNVVSILEATREFNSNPCPTPDGQQINFEDLDLAKLPGKISIWTKNRVLVSDGTGTGNNQVLHKLLTEKNVKKALKGVSYIKIAPAPVSISGGEITFENAVQIEGWTLFWSDSSNQISRGVFDFLKDSFPFIVLSFIFILLLVSLCKLVRTERGLEVKLRDISKKKKDYIVVAVSLIFLLLFFLAAHSISPKFLENIGYQLPLPLFTFVIALIDGFNPCNMFVLTCLMTLLISSSDSKARLYVVGFSFVFMVFLIYFLFMAAWLNVFKYVGFITPLRIGIAVLALGAGLINCKELLFFKKGISLTIPDQQRGPLMKKIYAMKSIIQKGTFPVLISSSIALATLASLIELPCTAGFPIIYTSILSARMLETSVGYYLYVLLYNLVYVLPLGVIITIFIFTFRGQPISQRQMEILKFTGGLIMVLLGIILLVNPGLIGLNVN